ncbi:50S ribosomal protein L22 [Akkermansiaceae bacterium]|jgi:large subunit ribosomal protein L22|nr:50S ribosomal protein L22 [Akkermansiaceae bacterium]
MEVKSTYKYARISPKKARDVARAIQGMPVSDALDVLAYTPRKAAQLVGKTLKSAVANAENNHELVADELTIKEATVGDGPTFKRFKPRARGSASAIRKRTSHLYIVLTDEEEIPEPRERSSKPKKRDQVSKPKKKAAAKSAKKEKKEEAVEEVKAAVEEVEEAKAPVEEVAEVKAEAANEEAAPAEDDKGEDK